MRRLALVLALAALLTVMVVGNALTALAIEVPEPVPEEKDLAGSSREPTPCNQLLSNGVFPTDPRPKEGIDSDVGTFETGKAGTCDVVLPSDPEFDPSSSSES